MGVAGGDALDETEDGLAGGDAAAAMVHARFGYALSLPPSMVKGLSFKISCTQETEWGSSVLAAVPNLRKVKLS